MNLSRRGLITGLISFVAAPAIVRAASLMPVKAIKVLSDDELLIALLKRRVEETYEVMRKNMEQCLYGDSSLIPREAFVSQVGTSVYTHYPLLMGFTCEKRS